MRHKLIWENTGTTYNPAAFRAEGEKGVYVIEIIDSFLCKTYGHRLVFPGVMEEIFSDTTSCLQLSIDNVNKFDGESTMKSEAETKHNNLMKGGYLVAQRLQWVRGPNAGNPLALYSNGKRYLYSITQGKDGMWGLSAVSDIQSGQMLPEWHLKFSDLFMCISEAERIETAGNTKFQDEAFNEALEAMRSIYKIKSAAYGPEPIAEGGVDGVLQLINNKVARLKTLIKHPEDEYQESIDDTLLDLANYAVILMLVRKGDWGK